MRISSFLFTVKVPLWSNFWFFFYIFVYIVLDFRTHLAKFQSIANIRSHFILTFISENLRPPLINLVPRLGCEWEKVTSKAQKKTSWVETIITISIENCTKNYFKVFVAFRVIFNIHPSLSDGSSPTPSGRFSFSNSVDFSTWLMSSLLCFQGCSVLL